MGLAKELGDAEKRFSAEQIVVLLRQIEVLMSQGKAAPVACRDAGISQQLRDGGANCSEIVRRRIHILFSTMAKRLCWNSAAKHGLLRSRRSKANPPSNDQDARFFKSQWNRRSI